MHIEKTFLFLFRSLTTGLALAFVLLMARPDWFGFDGPKVEFRESSAPTSGTAGGFVDSYSGAVELAAPAVVNINTSKLVTERAHPLFSDPFFQRFFGGGLPERQRLQTSLGSGVIVNEHGYILTNNHVIDGADEIKVGLRDGRMALATVVGRDPEADLAVLKIDLSDLPTITLGHSSVLKVGDVVLAIGNPFGVGQTVTLGIVSATGRNQLGINTFENFIQTDAAINPGNSGGALINARGELVGINTAIFSRTGGYQGIGFAIPIRLARTTMQQIIEYGRVKRGWLGIEVQEITPDLAESFGLGKVEGVIIAGVVDGGPAAAVGLAPGDILVEIDGEGVRGAREALTTIARTPPGRDVRLRVLRNKETVEFKARAGERPVNP